MQEKKKKMTPTMLFILLLGVVSLFSDMTHEGASSIRGAYLSLLGASAATIGFVSGLGEMIGYSLRLFFGMLTDRTHKYWTMTILGYVINAFACPALALVHEDGWIAACVLLLLERAGKAIEKPAKNTIMSFAASQEGAGRSFAIQEALDQIGAFIGPVLLFLVMRLKTGSTYEVYAAGFAVLTIPALLTIGALLYAKKQFPHPESFEPETPEKTSLKFKPSFKTYLLAICCFAFGFVDFSLITMHVARGNLFTPSELPLLYAGAMIIDAIAALFFGHMYDRKGIWALVWSTLLSAAFAPFVFGFHSRPFILLGIALWGIGMGAQESIMKAVVTTIVPKAKRASGYGLFEFAFGIFWFLGSWLMGLLYDRTLLGLICISCGFQLLAIPFYLESIYEYSKEQQVLDN